VDVVTGGASAAWGSDAVAGVVNFCDQQEFYRLQVNQELTQDKNNDHRVSKTDVTWGDDYMDGRLHLEGSASYLMAPDAAFVQNKDWFVTTSLFPTNPATGLPQRLHSEATLASTQPVLSDRRPTRLVG